MGDPVVLPWPLQHGTSTAYQVHKCRCAVCGAWRKESAVGGYSDGPFMSASQIMAAEPRPWADLAACQGVDPSLFFPKRGDMDSTAAAREVCAACPVKARCLLAGIFERHGMWGGKSERERRQIRRDPARVLMVRVAAEVEAGPMEATG